MSILLQGFCNLTMMRYTVYSGEPIIVGGLRTWPGPRFWMTCWAVFDLASVWPYNASNAAVPVAAIILGRLPQSDDDRMIVKALGFVIFLLAFVPLVFGGTVYRMLEKIMTAKLVLVLGYLSLIAVTIVSWPVIRDVSHRLLPCRHRARCVPRRSSSSATSPFAKITAKWSTSPAEPGKKTASRLATFPSPTGKRRHSVRSAK